MVWYDYLIGPKRGFDCYTRKEIENSGSTGDSLYTIHGVCS